jgi:hypothetical protein
MQNAVNKQRHIHCDIQLEIMVVCMVASFDFERTRLTPNSKSTIRIRLIVTFTATEQDGEVY